MVQFSKIIINTLSDRPLMYEFVGKTAGSFLRWRAQQCRSPEEFMNLISTVFKPLGPLGWSVSLQQVPQEIKTLLSIVRQRNVRFMMEIGTRWGGTLFLFSWTIPSNANILSLDLPSAESLKRGYDKFKTSYFTNFTPRGQRLTLLRGDSHNPISLSRTKSALDGRELDFLFIDGDHTYEGVKKDFEMYSPLVHKGGLVAFHDICGHDVGVSEVDRYWNEIKGSYRHSEMIENPKQGWAGIGVIYL